MDLSAVSPNSNNAANDDDDSLSISPYSSHSSSIEGYIGNGEVFNPESLNGRNGSLPFLAPFLQSVQWPNALVIQQAMMMNVFNAAVNRINNNSVNNHPLNSINRVVEACTQANQQKSSTKESKLSVNIQETRKKLNSSSSSEVSPAMTRLRVSEPDSSNRNQGNSVEKKVAERLKCHLCSFESPSDRAQEYKNHMDTHFDNKCPHCDYSSRTEGRLKRHVADFHSRDPPNTWSGSRSRDSNGDVSDPGLTSDGSNDCSGMNATVSQPASVEKPRKHKCKTCNYVSMSKEDFWVHQRSHIKPEKMLACPHCPFATEYKHHLEYHMRNHTGSKPFKCEKCNYECVNKSMLNSHLKSHSNIYQYRCADCSYATKYCHSLKLHLRKYEHKPAGVLNLDGTPNPYPIIDVYGTRRGPRPKKTNNNCKNDSNGDHDRDHKSPVPPSFLGPLLQLQTLSRSNNMDLSEDSNDLNDEMSPLNFDLHSSCTPSLNSLSMGDKSPSSQPKTKGTTESMAIEEAQPLDLSVKPIR
jgi:hypothetical protein